MSSTGYGTSSERPRIFEECGADSCSRHDVMRLYLCK